MIESKKTGVYKITNTINKKIYVGSATSTKDGFKDRIRTHIRLLRNNAHYNKHLQSSWNKYGENAFEFEIVEVIAGKDNILKREQYFIDLFKTTDRNVGYNKSPVAGNQLGFKHSDESKRKMSESAKRNSKQTSARMKLFMIGKKPSEEAKRKTSETLKGIKRDDNFKRKMREIATGRKMSDESKEKMRLAKLGTISKKRLKVIQLGKDGNLIKIWDCAGDAERDLKIPIGKISAVCLGQRQTTGGFKWKYYE